MSFQTYVLSSPLTTILLSATIWEIMVEGIVRNVFVIGLVVNEEMSFKDISFLSTALAAIFLEEQNPFKQFRLKAL